MYRNIVDNRNLSETHDPIYFRVTIDRITTLHVLCQYVNGGGDTIRDEIGFGQRYTHAYPKKI